METGNIKSYAPKARMEFMDAVAKRLNTFGISVNKKGELQVTEAIIQGSVLQIGDNNFDSSLAQRRQRLVERSQQLGYEQLVEQVAYTWFNRLSAIRYMEIHGYLGHGFRVLSHPSSEKQFEIIDHAQDAAEELGLDRNHIIDLKLAGNKNEELYRELLLGQCHKLHEAMPFLFESLNDETELLLPDNLTRTDSILRGLVDSIPEEDWQQVEIIGWLYQFYISDKKDEVIGKVVKSEDIPAATQLFTPNWIVKYLVQNSVGRHWLQTYPDSPIKDEMEYYIEPAEQTEEVNQQLKDITPESIDPETIKVLDPASGSGHILIEAYNVLKAIYEERGYRSRDIPKLILEKNIYGLDIDDRAAQLSGFSLMMMARQDDRRIFSRDIRLNVLSLQETEHLDLPKLWQDLNLSGDWTSGATQDMFGGDLDLSSFEADNRYQLLQRNIERFKQAKTFGSLIEVPAAECEALKELHDTMLELSESGDSIQRAAAGQIVDVVHQALLLSIRYDAVVANPPYMGNKGLSTYLKKFLGLNYQGFNKDLFLAFISNCINLCASKGLVALMTPNVWMYLNTYTKARNSILENTDINSLIELPLTGFKGATVQICCFVLDKSKASSFKGTYVRLVDEKGADIEMAEETRNCLSVAIHKNKFIADQCDFALIPASPISYWVSNTIRHLFTKGDSISDFVRIREGLNTGDNDRFLRYWWEVDNRDVDFEYDQQFNKKWSKHNKGGSFRRWYGNHDYIMNWIDGGEDIHEFHDLPLDYNGAPVRGKAGFFKSSISWSRISSGKFSARFFPEGFTYDSTAPSIFGDKSVLKYLLGFLNSNMSGHLLSIMSPTVDYRITNLNRLPVRDKAESLVVDELVTKAIVISKNDWDSYENSWDFLRQEMVSVETSIINDALYNLVEIYDERVKCLMVYQKVC